MSHRHSRRGFLKRGLAAAGAATAAGLLRGPYIMANPTAGQKLGVAVIGGNGMGSYSVEQALRENLVAMVDVDENKIAQTMQEKVKDLAKPKIFYDYRKMLDECKNDIDVVLIATPDHNHAPATIRAIDLGKHVFCQKPLAHNIREVYIVAKAAKDKKVLTQMGNQGQLDDSKRRIVEYIDAGAIGTVLESHTILGRNFGGTGGRPRTKPIPAGLHWDEWIGPAPYRDYHDGLHPFSWRDYRAFGTGTIGDMACHNVNPVFWGQKLGTLKKFTVTCLHTTGGSEEKYPQDNIILYELPEREGIPASKAYVYDHDKLKPDIMKETEKKYNRTFGEFTLFIGTKGMLGSDARIIPEEEDRKFPVPPRTLPRSRGGGPIEELFLCIHRGGTPCSNFPDAAGPLTAFALTGHLAQFAGVGKKLEWDVEKMECTNVPEINKYVRREYRKGWEV